MQARGGLEMKAKPTVDHSAEGDGGDDDDDDDDNIIKVLFK
jgi:hypothetical protein